MRNGELGPKTVEHPICRCARWEKAEVLSVPTDKKDEAGMVNHGVGFLRLFILGVINFIRAGNRFDLLCVAGEPNEAWVKERNVEFDRLGRVVFRINAYKQRLHGLARGAKFIYGGRDGLQIVRANVSAISVAEVDQ